MKPGEAGVSGEINRGDTEGMWREWKVVGDG